MKNNVFANFAPFYWDAGIPVMPLKKRSKAPILNEWSSYCRHFPSLAERDHWLRTYPESNIGLPFGEASGLCSIDIDTVDQEQVDAIMECLPASPWVRIGRKGCGLIFKWHGQKSFKIRDEGGMLCEFLANGNQMVMPGSIHPDCPSCGMKMAFDHTLKCRDCGTEATTYTSNTNLWEVLDKVQPLGMDIEEKLRKALGVKGLKLTSEGRSKPMVVIPAGERDIMMVKQAGYLARVVLGIDKLQRFSLAEAMDQMYTWVLDKTASAAGDDMDPEKGVAKLLEFLLKDVESGKTMPNGWDTGLTADQLKHPTIIAIGGSNESQRWTRTKAREWLTEQVELRPDDEDWLLEKIEELITALSKDEQFTPVMLDTVFTDITKKYGRIISKPVFNKAFRDAKAGDSAEADADHESIARRVLEMINREGEIRHAHGKFWQWNGSCFKQLDDADVHDYVEKIKGNVLCRRGNDYKSIVKLIAIKARSELVEEIIDGVNFANGFLDIDGELHEHSPRFGKTFTMPFNYAPERAASCHKWLAFLERVWGDDPDYADKVAGLQEAMAATMLGTAWRYQRAILLYGKAGTGKSTILEVLKAMMPPAAVSSLPPQEWGVQFSMTAMIGKTLNCCGELSESKPIAGEKFKEIVEGTIQTTEFKGMDKFDFKPVAAQWFASNFLPISRDGSEGFLRRWLILHFGKKVASEDQQVEYYKQLVAEEREAIAAWALQASDRLRRSHRYTLSSSHNTQVESMKHANNDVAAWLVGNDKVREVEDQAVFVDGKHAHDLFKWYMRDAMGMSQGRIANFERFMQMLDELGHPRQKFTDASGRVCFRIFGLQTSVPHLG